MLVLLRRRVPVDPLVVEPVWLPYELEGWGGIAETRVVASNAVRSPGNMEGKCMMC